MATRPAAAEHHSVDTPAESSWQRRALQLLERWRGNHPLSAAEALEVFRHAPTTALTGAADARRRTLHGDRVSYLAVGPGPGATATDHDRVRGLPVRQHRLQDAFDGGADVVWRWAGAGVRALLDEEAPVPLSALSEPGSREIVRLATAAGLLPCLALSFRASDSPQLRVDTLFRTRQLLARTGRTVALCLVPHEDARHDALAAVRFAAMARLCMPVPHIVAATRSVDLGMLLDAGCDTVGSVPLRDAAGVEQQIRAQGFEPVRRDPSFHVVGGALTPAHAVQRSQVR